MSRIIFLLAFCCRCFFVVIRLGSNIASLNAQRRLSEATDKLSSTFERLSSGMRINRASDDAAGLAIAENLNSNRRIATTAIRNINDGQSLLSIADGALQQQAGILMRMRELAEQSANGTFSSTQRGALNDEFESIKDEFYRISASTMFNGLFLLDGSSTANRFNMQVGLTGRDAMLQISIQDQGKLHGKIDLTKSGMNGGTQATSNWISSIFDQVTFTDEDLFENGFDGQIIMTTATDDQGRQRETAVFISRRFDGGPNDPLFIKAFTRSLDNPAVWEGEMTVFDNINFGDGGPETLNSDGTIGTNNVLSINVGGDNATVVTVDFENIRFYDGVNGAAYANTTAALEVLDVRDAARSRFALDELASRLADNASVRGTLGASMQRLSVAQQNLSVAREAFAAAESRIRDADIAQETADLVRQQILQRTSTAILAQANNAPRLALDLLKAR